MDDCNIRIGLTGSGFEVEVLDPTINDENSKPKSSSYRNPWVSYSFAKKEQVLEFIEDALDIVKPRRGDQSTAFDAAFKEAISGVEDDADTDPKE